MSNEAKNAGLRTVFAERIKNAIGTADELLLSGMPPSWRLEADLNQAYKDVLKLERDQILTIIKHREQIHDWITAYEAFNADMKEIIKIKATFMILQDAVNGSLPELKAGSVDANYLNQLDMDLRTPLQVDNGLSM
jgi:hypothetical protein